MKKIALSIVVLIMALTTVGQAVGDYRSRTVTMNWSTDGDWEICTSITPVTWATVTTEGYPGETGVSGTVTILREHAVTLDESPANNIGALTFAVNDLSSSLTIAGTSTLFINGAITFNDPSATSTSQTLDIGNGTVNASAVLMANTGGATETNIISLANGTLNVTGDITMAGSNAENYITFSGAGQLNVTGNLGTGNYGRLTGSSATISIGGNFDVATFTANTSTIVFNGLGLQRLDNAGSYYNVTFDGGGTKYLVGNTTLLDGGTFTFNSGNLDLAGFDLTINNNVAFSGTPSGTSMIDLANGGRIYKSGNTEAHWLHTYPIGTGTDYSPLTITATAGDVNGNLYINVVDERHPLLNGTNNALKRYWDFSSTNLGFSSVTGTLTYTDSDVSGGIAEANLTSIGLLQTSGWTENQAGTSYDHGNNQITFSTTAGILGSWTLGESSGCFDATLPDKYTVANGNWVTGSVWNGGTVPTVGQSVAILHNITRNNAGDANPGSLTIEAAGSLNLNNQDITVTGTTIIYGSLVDGNNTGTNTFTGLVTVESGGSILTANNSQFVFEGGITNNGTINKTGTGAVAFQTNPQALSGTGTITMNGVITVTGIEVTNNGTVELTSTANPALTGTGTWTQGNGSSFSAAATNIDISTFDADASGNIVIYNRNNVQTINTTTAYHHLNIEGNNIKTVAGNLTVNGDLKFQNLLNTIALNTTANNVVIAGDLIAANSGYAATITQTTGALSAANAVINGGNTFNLNANVTITGNINVSNSSTLVFSTGGLAAYNYLVNNDITIDVGSELSNGTSNYTNSLSLQGHLTANGNFDLYYDANSRTSLTIDSNTPHSFSGTPTAFQLYNFTINPSSNTITVGFDMDIEGSVDIGLNSSFEAGTYTHSVYGDWTNNGGTFTGTGSTMVFDGGNQYIYSESGFNNVSFINADTKYISGDVTLTGNLLVSRNLNIGNDATPRSLTVHGNVTIDNGFGLYTRDLDAIHTLSIGGNLIVNGTFDLYRSLTRYTTLHFIDNAARTISGTPTLIDIYSMELDATSNITQLEINITGASVRNAITIGNGASLDLNAKNMELNETLTIATGGTLVVDENSVLTFIAAGKSIQNAGTLSILGTAGNIATITASAGANAFYIDNTLGSTLIMNYFNIDYLTGSGITVAAGGNADGTADNFSNGTFGANSNSTQCLNLSGVDFATNNPVTTTNTVFNNPVGFNVARTSGTGTINFIDATGSRAGESFDNDNGNPGTLVNWTFPSSTYVTTKSGNFMDPTVWNADPTGHFTDATAVFQILDGHNITLDGDIDVLELLVGNGVSGSLIIGNDATIRNLTTRESLTVQAGGSISVGSSAIHEINIYGNLNNSGTVNLRPSSSNVVNVNFYGPSSKVNGGVPIIFNTITFKTGTVTTAHTAMDINRNVEIETGATFNDGDLTHTVARDWTETGTGVRTGNGTINFDGVVSSVASTDGTDIDLYHVIFSNSGAADLGSNVVNYTINILGSLTINNDKQVQLINDPLNIAGDFTTAVAARFNGNTALTTFNGTSDQTLAFLGDVIFYDVAFSGASTKTVNGNITTTRYFTINTGAIVDGAGNHEIGNTLTVNGTCNFLGSITMKAGNITSTNATLDFANLADLNIAGNIYLTTASSLDVSVNGNVTIQSNYLVINNNTSLSGTGNFNLEAGLNLYVRDNDGFPTGFAAYNLDPASTVRYDSDMDQIVRGGAGLTYGNVYIYNQPNATARVKTADGTINISGWLDFVDDPITFDVDGFDLNISGNISRVNAATIDMTAGGTLTFDADNAAQTMGAGTYNLTNLTFTLASPSATRTKTIVTGTTLNLSGNFTATCGSTGSYLLDIALNDNSIGGSPINLNLGQNCRLTTTAVDFGTNAFNNFTGTVDLLNGWMHFAKTNGIQYIPTGVTYGNITFSGTQIKEAAGNLTISGDISRTADTPYFKAAGYTISLAGNWQLGTANTRTADLTATDKVIFNGIDQTIYPSNFQHLEIANTGIDSLSGGNITIYGNFTVKTGAGFAAKGRSLTVYGNWLVENGGVFTQDLTGTVTFASTTANQTLESNSNSYFGNITITKNTGADFQTLDANTDLVVKRNLILTIDASVFDLNNHQLNVGGNFYVYSNAHVAFNSFIPGTGTVIFDGADIQEIRHYSAYPLSFHHITFTTTTNKMFRCLYNPAVIEATRKVIVTGNWTNNGQNVYAYVVGDGNTYINIDVAGNWVNNGTFYHVNAGTVTFNGADQSIGSSDFWNVVFAGTGTKTLSGGAMSVKRNLTINDGVTLDVDAIENNNILVSLNWDMSAIGAIFEARNGLVRFDGGGSIFTGHTGENTNKNFYDIEISATFTTSGDLDVDNDFTITSGTFTTGVNTIYIGGSLYNNANFTHTNDANAHVIFNAAGGTKEIDPGAGIAFRKLTIDAATGTVYNVLNDFSINSNYDLTVNEGILNLNSHNLTVNTNNARILINPGGEFNINESATVTFTGTNQSIQNEGGIFKMVGIAGNTATLTRTGGSYYIVQNSGTFHAKYYRCETIGAGANGSIIINGGSLDATNNFSNGTFISGASTATSTAYIDLNGLNIDNATNLIINQVTFNSGGTTNRNIKRDVPPAATNDGYVECQDCIGSLAGPNYETDDASASSGYVRWTYPNGFFWEGDFSDNWHDNDNWEGGTAPSDSNHYVYIDISKFVGPNKVAKINTANALCGRIIVNDDGSTGLSFEVDAGFDLSVIGAVVISNGGVVTVADPTSEITVHGDWTNSGTFNNGSGTVNFRVGNETQTITQSSGAFYNMNLYSAQGGTFTLGANLDIDNDFTLVKGIFDVLTRNITIGGNWLMVADSAPIFVPKVQTVTFDGADQTISNGTFYNLTSSGTGTKTLLTNIDVNGDVTIGTGTILDGLENELYVGRNWINNGTFNQTGSGAVIFDGGTQQIDNTGSTTTQFNKVTFAGTGTKTFYKASQIFGDFVINSGCGAGFSTFNIDGGVAVNSLTNNGSIYIDDVDNFPINFETISMSGTSNAYYRYAAGDQVVKNSTAWSYGNLILQNNSTNNYNKVVEAGDLKVTGTLTITHTDVIMDMNTNSANLILTGNLAFPTGGQQINWGTGTTKLTHIGGDWNIDADITGFNNLELSGTLATWKRMYNNLDITGNVTVKNSIYLLMDANNNTLPKTMTSTGVGKTFTLENNARIYNSTPSATAAAMPTGFATYNLHSNSIVYLRAPTGENQTVYTANNIIYGRLTFQNTKTVTTDGIATLQVVGDFNMGTCIFTDGGQSIITGGATTAIYDYTPSPGVTFTFNGGNQAINNSNLFPLRLENLVFSGTGTKTLGSNNPVIINGNVTINANIAVISVRTIEFNGSTFTNNGKFRHTSTFTFNGSGAQSINPGTSQTDNYFTNVDFAGTNTITFNTNGADINGTLSISSTATVNMGTLAHTISGTITNSAGGTWNTTNADITFDGGNQNINTPSFAANHVTISGTGTKRMFSNWDVNNLNIISSTLNNYDNISAYFALLVRGNYTNSGVFTHNNQSDVTFNATTDVTIDNGAGTFAVVNFGDDAGATNIYNLTATSTTIRQTINLNEDAHVKLNGNTLIFGYNTVTAKLFTVKGILDVDANASLQFQNQGSVCTMNVDNAANPAKAILKVVGNDLVQIATITRNTTGGQIIIINNAAIEAKYYLIEYLANAGIDIQANATLHATNNFSYGTFSNINNVAGACYLNLEAGTYAGADIVDVAFNLSATPVTGIFNVKRQVSAPNITFGGLISGNLGSYKYEKDELSSGPPAVLADASQGKLQWPGVLETVWTGAINENWNNAGNWSDGVPTSTIDAIIPGSLPNDPVLNVNGECKKLRITSGVLELDGGFNITTYGDITIGEGTAAGKLIVSHTESNVICGGDWTKGTNGIFVHGASTVIFNSASGSVNINSLASDFYHLEFNNAATTFYFSGSTLNVLGNFTITNGTVNPNTAAYTLNLGGDFNNQGTFVPGTGTLNLNGSVNQTITNGDLYNVTVNGSAVKYTEGATTISGTTVINSTLQANTGSNINFVGNVTINGGATFNDGNQSHAFGGATWTGTGTYAGAGTITFNRTIGNQAVTASSFNNLIVACTGRVLTLTGNLNIAGNLTVEGGVNRLDILDKLITNTSGTGTFTVENSATVYITGANHFPTGFIASNLGASTTVDYRGDGNQIIGGGSNVVYGHLTLTNTNTKTLGGAIEILGNLNFNTATLDVTANNYSITIARNWNNNNAAGGTFIPRAGEVIFNGNTGNQTITVVDNSTNPFYSIIVNKSTGTLAAPNTKDLTVAGDLIVTLGIYSANGRTTSLGGDLYAENGSFANSGTFLLNKASGTARIKTNFDYNANTKYLNSLTINSGAVYTLESDMAVYGDFVLSAGTLNGDGFIVALGNQSTDNISINGNYIIGAGGQLLAGNGSSIDIGSSGSFEVVGTGASNAIVTNNAHYGGRYGFTCNGGIKAAYYQFHYMNANGIRISSTGLIDVDDNFSNGTFTNGQNGGTFLVIENSQSFVAPNYIDNVSFPTNPGGALAKNVEKTLNSGTLEFWEASGVFSGALYEKDDYNRINWTGVIVLTWDGSASTNWNNTENWTANFGPNIVPTGAENVVIANVTNKPKLTVSGQVCKNLTINTGSRIIIETDLDSENTDLEILGDFTMLGSATLELKTMNDFVSVQGNWTIPTSATFTNNGTITFNGNGSVKTIDNGGKNFNYLNIEGNTIYTLGRNTTIAKDLNIALGATLDASNSNYSLTISGNWLNEGTYVPRVGLVTFNATLGSHTINNSTSAFHHLAIIAPGIDYTLSTNDLKVNGNFTLSAGTFNQNGLIVNMGDGAGTDYLYITGSGIYNIGPNGTLKMGANAIATIYDGGTFTAVGTDKDNPAKITRQSTGNYAFAIESLGNFGAQFYQFEYMNADGIYMKSGALLDAINNLSNGVFSNGFAGGTYLKLENYLPSDPGEELIDNVTFNAGPTYNVTRTTGTTVANFKDASGVLGTFSFENDAVMPADPITGLLIWSSVNSTYWTGNASNNNWHDPANWLCNCVPGLTNSVTISPDPFNPVISTGVAEAKRITIESGAVLTLNGQNLTVAEDIWFEGTFTVTGNPTITTQGGWTSASGTFNADNSTVVLAATSGNFTVDQGSNTFYNLEVNSGGEYDLHTTLTVTNNFTLISGILDATGFDAYIGGDWVNNGGTFTTGTNTVYFNGSGSNVLDAGASSFYNASFTGNATTLLNGNLTIANQFTQSNGIIDLSSDGGTTNYNLTVGNRFSISAGTLLGRSGTITVGENWNISGTGIFTAGTSTVVLNSASGTRTITPRGQAFNNLTLNGGATYNLGGTISIGGNLSILTGGLSVTTLNYPVSIAGNWFNNSVFTPFTGAVTFNGTQTQNISGSASHTFGGLIVNNTHPSGLTLSSPVAINSSLTLTSGIVYTSAINLLTLNNNATSNIGSDASFVEGPMKKVGNQAFTFPLGDTVWAPLAITAPSLVTDAFTAEYFYTQSSDVTHPCTNCNAAIFGVSRIEYWDIQQTNGYSTPDVTLYFKDMTRSAITDLSDLVFAHFDGSEWVRMGTNIGMSDGVNSCYLTGTGFTSYSPLAPASESGNNPLPIELITFNAIQADNNVNLTWITGSELNNDYYTIERSKDGKTFSEILRVAGIGTSMLENTYTAIDKNVPQGLFYYRLKQTDFDGVYSYSKVLSINVNHGNENSLSIYPNPSSGSDFNIRFVGNDGANVSLILVDVLGKIQYKNEYKNSDGLLLINLHKKVVLQPGTYYLVITSDEQRYQKQIVIIEQ